MNLISNLESHLVQTKFNLYTSNQIKYLKHDLCDWADLVLETENFYVCFKDFWTLNNLTPGILNNYLYGSEQINQIFTTDPYYNLDKKYIFVLMVKSSNLNFNNEILNQKNIHVIKNFNQNKLIKEISYFLYSNNIFFYEPDNSVIMLE